MADGKAKDALRTYIGDMTGKDTRAALSKVGRSIANHARNAVITTDPPRKKRLGHGGRSDGGGSSGSWKTGGKIRKTGPANLHAGERVIPRSKVKKVERLMKNSKVRMTNKRKRSSGR